MAESKRKLCNWRAYMQGYNKTDDLNVNGAEQMQKKCCKESRAQAYYPFWWTKWDVFPLSGTYCKIQQSLLLLRQKCSIVFEFFGKPFATRRGIQYVGLEKTVTSLGFEHCSSWFDQWSSLCLHFLVWHAHCAWVQVHPHLESSPIQRRTVFCVQNRFHAVGGTGPPNLRAEARKNRRQG